jgi:putative tryptophan/tyrosine transport system substrate-binding protein
VIQTGRRQVLLLVGALAVSAIGRGSKARAQSGRVYRVGILETVPAAINGPNLNSLLRGLRERGYVEGQNLRIEYRSADGGGDRFPDLAAELVRLPVDPIVTRGTPAANAAKNATIAIPIVMAAIGEPIGVGVVSHLARPGENLTGFSAFATELAGKRIELLQQGFPAIARLGFLANMRNPAALTAWQATRTAAAALGISAQLLDIRTEPEIAAAFAVAERHKLDAVAVGIDALTQANAKAISV